MIRMKYIIALTCILLGVQVITSAQTSQVSDQDVELEGLFIDASKEKLLNNFEEAEAKYNEIIKKLRNNAAVYFELARVQMLQDKNQEALKSIKKAIELDLENDWYALLLATLYQKMDEEVQAANVYKELAERRPNNIEYFEKWAFHLVKANKVVEAIEAYNQLEKLTGISEELSRKKYLLYAGLGDNKKAIRELEKLIAAFPKEVNYKHQLAAFYLQIGENNQANTIFQNILTQYPNDAKAKLALASNGGKRNLASQLMTTFQQKDITIDLKINQLLPSLQQIVKNNDKALATEMLPLGAVLTEIHPEEAKAFATYADLLYYSGDKTAARTAYEKTLSLDQSVYLIWEQLLYVLLEQRDFSTLKSRAEDALDLFPNQARVYLLEGIAMDELELDEDAVALLKEATFIAGNNNALQLEIQTQLGKVLAELGSVAASNQAFEKALQLQPNHPKVLAYYSYALAQRNENLVQANKMATEANRLQPNQSEIEHALGWVFYKSNDWKNSKIWLEKAANSSNEALIIEHYGDVLFKLGQLEDALVQWQRAKSSGSKSELLNKKIADRKLYE